MPEFLNFIKTLNLYLEKSCKVVYRDGGNSSPAKAFYGKLVAYDEKFQVWEGKNDRRSPDSFKVSFNHDDVNRITLEL